MRLGRHDAKQVADGVSGGKCEDADRHHAKSADPGIAA